jgi:hypothetical protein
MEHAREPLKDKDVVCLGHLRRVFPLLDRLNDVGCGRDAAGNRQLFFGDYCRLVLLYIWNPLIDSLRGLREAVGLATVAKALGVGRFSLGSFSESVRVFEPGSSPESSVNVAVTPRTGLGLSFPLPDARGCRPPVVCVRSP